LGIPEDEVEMMAQRMSGRDVSLDRPMDDDSGGTLMDFQKSTSDMSVDERIAHEEELEFLKEKLKEIRPELSEREKIILDERILNDEPLTLQEIGEKHGITREAVRQMEARVMKKIKAKMESLK
jgi:RNA polymerase sigma-32 factor